MKYLSGHFGDILNFLKFSQFLLTKAEYFEFPKVSQVAHSEPLFKKLDILKFTDNISLYNCVFVFDFLHGNLPKSFCETFRKIEDSHDTETRQACTGMLSIPKYNTTQFGLKSIYKKCINSRNQLTSEINEIEKQKYFNKMKSPYIDLSKFSKSKLKETIKAHMVTKYDG